MEITTKDLIDAGFTDNFVINKLTDDARFDRGINNPDLIIDPDTIELKQKFESLIAYQEFDKAHKKVVGLHNMDMVEIFSNYVDGDKEKVLRLIVGQALFFIRYRVRNTTQLETIERYKVLYSEDDNHLIRF